uniref:Uncharacterized protein n=1 Tax=Rhizoctonia solani TaxID=456999 RepID=N0A593_9AGAM|nr:hypothetical protein RSOL_m01010 [Rhizoctonia solani]AGK45417.1 hypothetical protein RSOL_m01010 [Rhizoctonia solani]
MPASRHRKQSRCLNNNIFNIIVWGTIAIASARKNILCYRRLKITKGRDFLRPERVSGLSPAEIFYVRKYSFFKDFNSSVGRKFYIVKPT